MIEEVKDKGVQTNPEKPTNILIEGDNYHSLSVLNYTHQGRIDVIYIDPPFNTGARNWIYNNDYVDINDSYRHSKWLSMMYKRLKLAKKLLKEDGVLICAIDENECNRLALILEEVFSNHEQHCVTIVHNPRGVQGSNFSYTHEYAFFSFPKGKKIIGNRRISESEIKWRNLRDNGGESLRTDARNCFYPIIIDPNTNTIVDFGDVCDSDYHPEASNENHDGMVYVYPIDTNRVERKWRYARQSVEEVKDLLRIKNSRRRYEIEIGKDFGTVRTVWQDSRYDANEYGTKLVHALVPDSDFDFPKSLYNVYDCIAPILYDRRNAIILDFFAGSGTTGHAVALLNKEDEGNRQFILCTNNENGIAQEVCHPRIEAVIRGNDDYPDITGIESNLKYYKTGFVKKSSNRDEMKMRITEKCSELLCLRESIFYEKHNNDQFLIYSQNDRHMGIFYALERESLVRLKSEMDTLHGDRVLYCFTLDPLGLNMDDFLDWHGYRLEPIPQQILDIYEQIYEY